MRPITTAVTKKINTLSLQMHVFCSYKYSHILEAYQTPSNKNVIRKIRFIMVPISIILGKSLRI